MHQLKTYHSPLYRDFKAIARPDYKSIVHFFEKHETEIFNLEFSEYFEMLCGYAKALFEMGSYTQHIMIADVVIESSIENNIHIFQGEDIFKKTLFRKAASHYQLMEYKKSQHILKEIIKMNPGDSESISFLKKVVRSQKSNLQKNTRATAMLCFLITPILICIDILILDSFYGHLSPMAERIWKGIFLLGWVILLSGDLWHRIMSHRRVALFLHKVS
ncbi:MAG: hypothetical protein KDC24_06335 [Saprospiraceae bacterium]|nr:hypothetical protein [Saprospiraceae bacterium]